MTDASDFIAASRTDIPKLLEACRVMWEALESISLEEDCDEVRTAPSDARETLDKVRGM